MSGVRYAHRCSSATFFWAYTAMSRAKKAFDAGSRRRLGHSEPASPARSGQIKRCTWLTGA